MLRTIHAAAVLFLISVGSVNAQRLPAEIVDRDKPYGGHPRQVIDVTARPYEGMKPAILLVHGGSWQAGDKRSAVTKTKYLLAQGFAVAAINYRLHPEVSPQEQASDVAAAAVWLAKNADAYGIDPGAIYLAGHGAGGHLVSLVGTDPAYLAKHGATPADLGGVMVLAAATLDVPADMEASSEKTTAGRTLRQVFGEDPQRWKPLSPLHMVPAGQSLPPFLIAYPSDELDGLTRAKPFATMLRQRGGAAVMMESIGRDQDSLYRLFGSDGDATTEAALHFMRGEASGTAMVETVDEDLPPPSIPWLFAFQAPEIDGAGQRMTGSQISTLMDYQGQIFAGNAHPREIEESRRGQILRLDAPDDRWQLDLQMPRGYTRVAALASASFETDAKGRPIQRLDYLLAGASYESEAGKPAPAGLFIRTPSGNWAHQDIGSAEGPLRQAEVGAISAWRDPELGLDMVLTGSGPSPLGIHRGVYDPSAPGGLQFEETTEYELRGQETMVGFAQCGGRLYAATSRQILRRVDGAEPRWEPLMDLEELVATRPYLEGLDIYWQKSYAIDTFRCDLSAVKPTLAFTTLNRAFRFSPGDETPLAEQNLAALIRSELGRDPHYIIAGDATLISQDGRNTEEWIGIEVYYEPSYLATMPEFPYWPTGFGMDGLYLIRKVQGGNVTYQIDEIAIRGHNPAFRPLAKVAGFARSPFEDDDAVYGGGFAPRFEEVSNTAWIVRGEL